ncbi:MAG TPA: hypothetical protein VIM73_22560 [Polyangiaceae bacterium]
MLGHRMPFLRVTLEGEDITSWVESVTVTEDDRQADNMALVIGDLRMLYSDALFEGSVAEVDLGYASDGEHALMLRATVTKVELDYPNSGVPRLTLKGEDKSIEMGLVEKKKLWRNQKVSDIVRAVAEPYGFAEVIVELDPDPTIERRPINQDGKTDLAFLQELARRYFSKCFVELDEDEREVLYFIPERAVLSARRADRLLLAYRLGHDSNLISFSPQFDSSYIDRLKEVEDLDERGTEVRSQDRPPADEFVWTLDPARLAQASAADRERILRLYAIGLARKQELQARLQERRPAVGEVAADQGDIDSTTNTLESRRFGMSASGTVRGNIWLRAKSMVVVDGVAERFNGEWYVSNATHKIDRNGYQTSFRCSR